jgi:hypothetical protein
MLPVGCVSRHQGALDAEREAKAEATAGPGICEIADAQQEVMTT